MNEKQTINGDIGAAYRSLEQAANTLEQLWNDQEHLLTEAEITNAMDGIKKTKEQLTRVNAFLGFFEAMAEHRKTIV